MREVIAIAFAVFAVLVVFVLIAQRRFYGAYSDRYLTAEGHRPRWLWAVRPFRPPRTFQSWFRPLDDPLVERRRRQHLLAWGGIALWFAVPIALILYGAIFRR